MHITVPLAMFCLDALSLNHELCERAQNLSDRLIHYQVDTNREMNNRYKNSGQRTTLWRWLSG